MRMRRKTETLAAVGLFRSLDAANVDLLDTQCSWRRLSRNQWIVDYQDTTNDVFFIVSGAVRVKLQSASGREVLLREINAGDFFGELAAFDNEPRSAGIIAVTDVTVARMPSSVFRTAVHSYPDVCDQLLALLASQIRMLANRVNDLPRLMPDTGSTRNCCAYRDPKREDQGKPWSRLHPRTRRSQRASASVVKR